MHSLDVSVHTFYAFILVLSRIGGLMVAAPVLGNAAIPRLVKAGFVLVFSMIVVPLVTAHTGPVPENPLLLAGALLNDALFGVALGYLARILFSSVEMAGYFTDTQMGFGFVNLIDPFTEQQTSLLSTFEFQLAVTLFLMSNGHLMLLSAVVDSFQVLPPGAVSPHSGFGLTIIPLLKAMFALGLRMSLPAIGVLMIVDIGLGLTARFVPQINVFIVGMPAKIIVGMATVALLLPVLAMIVGQILAGTNLGLNALIAGSR